MKKITLSILFSVACFAAAHAQNVGIGTDQPTQKLDVNGSMRVRTLATQSYPNGNRVITHQADGTLMHTPALDVLFSTGFYVKSSAGRWQNLLVGGKGAKLDFSLRLAAGSTDIIFSLLYQPGGGFTFPNSTNVLANTALRGWSLKNVTFQQVAADEFFIRPEFNNNSNVEAYHFKFVRSGSSVNINLLNQTSIHWVQGTIISNPNLD